MGERVLTPAPSPEHSHVLPPRRPGGAHAPLQTQLLVGPVDDPFEREADRAAHAAMGMSGPFATAFGEGPLAASLTPFLQRTPSGAPEGSPRPNDEEGRHAQRSPAAGGAPGVAAKGDPPPEDEDEKRHAQRSTVGGGGGVARPGVERSIDAMAAGGGRPLDPASQAFFAPRFGYDFADVRVHDGTDAAVAARALGARAFTVGNHIFFGAGEYRPDASAGRLLLAHELTHTIQQTPAAARAARLAPAPVRVQRAFGGVGDAIIEEVRQIAEADVPPWELLTVLIGRDPLSEKPVDVSARSWMHAVLKLVPDGMAIFEDMERNKTLEKTAAWFEGEVARLDLTWEKVKALLDRAWDALSAVDIFRPAAAWARVRPIFADTIRRLVEFVEHVGARVVEAIRSAVLEKIAAWAKGKPGYTLLTLILERDPVTDEEVKRTPKAFVHAVLELVPNGDRIREHLEKSQAIEKAVAWLEEQLGALELTWELIKELFTKAWNAFRVADLLDPVGLLTKMGEIFGPHLTKLLRFVSSVGRKMLELVFEGAMAIAGPVGLRIVGIVKKLGDTFDRIAADPIGFVANLVEAINRGFRQFGTNIWEHLKEGLIGWLVGALSGAGLVLPRVWDLKGIVDLVLQVIGVTYAKLRAKLVAVVGDERVAMIERVFDFVKALVTDGPAAAWERIVEAVGNLWDMVIGGIKDWAVTKIVTAAVTKLATMLNPAGAVIQAIIAIYNTIAFFLERFTQIAALVESIVDSISEIAAGKLAQAANYVERTMARTIPVILGFLSRLIGLGDVSGAIKNVITLIQGKVDAGIDRVIAWIVEKAKSLLGKDEPTGDPRWSSAVAAISEEIAALSDAERTEEALTSRIAGWKHKHGFTELSVAHHEGEITLEGAMSPKKKVAAIKDPALIVKELEGEEYVQVKRGAGWFEGFLEGIDPPSDSATVPRMIRYRVVFPAAGTVKGAAAFSAYGESIRKYQPGTEAYLSKAALEAANSVASGDWSPNYELARKVLNYRARSDNQQRNLPGKQWHHIHEQAGDGPDSVENLALTSTANNQLFGRWFGELQPTITLPGLPHLEGTGAKPLRQHLRDRGDKTLWRQWGEACLVLHHVAVVEGSRAEKGRWRHIPAEAS